MCLNCAGHGVGISANLSTQVKHWETPPEFTDNFRSPDAAPDADARILEKADRVEVTAPANTHVILYNRSKTWGKYLDDIRCTHLSE